MYDDAKALPMKAASDSPSDVSKGRLPIALVQVRERATSQLRQGLHQLFDDAADALFELAGKACNETDQLYFQRAMSDLRRERKRIERAFMAHFNAAFLGIGQEGSGAGRKDRLSLVGNDELESTVAVDAMVARVLARDGLALGHLGRRFDAVLGTPLADHDNPLGPVRLCEYFLRAGRSQSLDLKVKALLLSLFESAVLDDIGQLYAQANQLLGALGVLPDLKALPSRRSGDPVAGSSRPEEGAAARANTGFDERVQAVFVSLQGLLPAKVENAPLDDGGPVLSQHDLMRLLTHLQHCRPLAGAEQAYDLRFELGRLVARLSMRGGVVYRIGADEEDVIRLVSLLFAEMAADTQLADYSKYLIARLQVPLLKVALLDKRVFSHGNHPARRLLDELAGATVGVGEGDDPSDSLCLCVEQIVQRLTDEFIDDPVIFFELLADFLLFAQGERRRSELLEQRNRDAEQGRANAEQALQRVEQALNQKLHARILPRRVIGFIETAWSQVLLLDWLKHGANSAQWQQSLQTLDALIWSVEPHADAESRLRLLEMVPGLLKALREGLRRSAFDPFATGEFFNHLEALHVQAFQAASADEGDILQLAVVDEIVLGAKPSASPVADEPRPEAQAAWAQVAGLRPGAWLQIQENQEQCLRCKVSTIVESSNQFVFVNRRGFKVLEKTAAQLALLFDQGRVRLLDDAPVFERVLNAMVRRLRGHSEQPHQ